MANLPNKRWPTDFSHLTGVTTAFSLYAFDGLSAGWITLAEALALGGGGGGGGGTYTFGTGLNNTSGNVTVVFGTGAGQVMQANDTRVVNAVQKVVGGTSGHVAVLTSDGSIADGGAFSTGGGGSGTVGSGSANTLAYYPASGTSIGSLALDASSFTITSGVLYINGAAIATLTDINTLGALQGADVSEVNRGGVDYKETRDENAEYVRTPVAPGQLSDSSGTITINLGVTPLPRVYDCVMSGTGRTLAITGAPASGQTLIRIRFSGSGTLTAYPANTFWRGGGGAPTLTNRCEVILERVGAEWWGSFGTFS